MTYLDILEHGDKKPLENEGADQVLAKLGGADIGVPFLAFLNSGGEMIVNSMRPPDPAKAKDKGGNIGHPYEPEEVDWFLVMVRKAAPTATPDELLVLEKWLRAQKK